MILLKWKQRLESTFRAATAKIPMNQPRTGRLKGRSGQSAFISRNTRRLNKAAKALAVFGPNYVKKRMGDASALNGYAWFWQGQNENLASALLAARKSVELSPRAAAYDTLSAVYIKLKNYTEALKAAEKAVELGGPQVETYKRKLDSLKKLMEKKDGE